MLEWPSWWETPLKVLMACVVGAAIGWEREVADRPAGLRTHTLVCLGACLVMILSRYVAGANYDPGRMAAQVVSGIGFLGAGTILRSGSAVRGLTTAASLWAMAAVGLAVGVGWYYGALLFTLAMYVVLRVFRGIERRLHVKEPERHRMTAVVTGRGFDIAALGRSIAGLGCRVARYEYSEDEDGLADVRLDLMVPPGVDLNSVLSAFRSQPGVDGARWTGMLDRLSQI